MQSQTVSTNHRRHVSAHKIKKDWKAALHKKRRMEKKFKVLLSIEARSFKSDLETGNIFDQIKSEHQMRNVKEQKRKRLTGTEIKRPGTFLSAFPVK